MNLLDMLKNAGIIGAGGAGFPTHAKLASKAEYILLNGAECEPLLRVDQQLMAMYPDEIIKGFEAAGRLVGADKAIIGIKEKHKDVIQLMRERIGVLGFEPFVSVKELPDVYPAGDEQVLVYELTGRVVPETGIPIQVGCVVINSETALNIQKASMGIPVTETYMTLAGDIPNRMTIKVPVGTPVMDVLKLSGIENFEDYAVIDGGPMMGPVMANLDGYVLKKNKGYVILKKDHPIIRRKSIKPEQARRVNRASCEQCRMCTDLCPRYLLGHDMQPHKMMRTISYNLKDITDKSIAYLCCQCNLCELFSCPAGLYPKSANMMIKQELMSQGIKYQVGGKEYEARSSRSYRMLPSKRLIARLGLKEFDKPAPMCDIAIEPPIVYLALAQHVGAPAAPAVMVGEHVVVGQAVGMIPEGSLSAAVHASVTGTVISIDNGFVAIRRD